MIAMIACKSQNGVIGFEGKIPWKFKDDMAWFKSLTLGHVVVMGRKTWESLPVKPLPNRKNIVISRTKIPGVQTVNLDWLYQHHDDEIFVIGGEQIYRAAMQVADYIFISTIQKDYVGDAFFPEIKGFELECSEFLKSKDVGTFKREIFKRSSN